MLNVSKVPKYDPLNGGTLWTHCGVECGPNYNDNLNQLGIEIEFSETANREFPWRTSVKDGQLPYFLIWPL